MEAFLPAVHIEHDEEANLFSARVPDVPGCGEGTTEAEAISDLKESLRAYRDALGMDHAEQTARVLACILAIERIGE